MKNKHLIIPVIILFMIGGLATFAVAEESPFGMFAEEADTQHHQATSTDKSYEEFKAQYKELEKQKHSLSEPTTPSDHYLGVQEDAYEHEHGHHDEEEPFEYRSAGEYTLKEDVRLQTVDQLRSEVSIDDHFIEAKRIKYPEPKHNSNPVEDEAQVILTEEEIIRSIVQPENKADKIDLDFDEVTLSDIFRTLGAASGINVMLDPAIKDQALDLHLKQVTLQEAFMLIANAYDLGFKKVEASLYVTLKEKIREENLASKIIKLENIPVQEAQVMISDLIQTVNVSEEINSLIVIGEPHEIVKVQKVIERIDIPQPQVVLEAKIIEVNRDALKDLGVDWSDEIRVSYQEGGRPQDLDDDESPADRVFEVNRFARTAIGFETVIKMLENQNKAKVLSNPSITTLNDKEAEIFIGDRVPYTVTNVTGGVATTDVRWVEPGIRLIITPSIIEDDFVVIKVEPEVSFIAAFRGPNDEFPQVKTREATAYVRVENGVPFVLGGLLNQEDKKSLFKVPVLGDLPLLGNLFSHENQTLIDTELIITVKPTVVRGGA